MVKGKKRSTKQFTTIFIVSIMIILLILVGGYYYFLIKPSDQPPIAMMSVSNVCPFVGEEVIFNGSGSHDDNGMAEYVWEFGDGAVLKGVSVSHDYSSNRKFMVKLTVKDSASGTDSEEKYILVNVLDNSIKIDVYPPNALVNDTVTFNATRTRNINDITGYYWNFDDGEVKNGTSPVTTHSFTPKGSYNVSMITEHLDGTLRSREVKVGIYEPDPSIENRTTILTSTIGEPDSLDPAYDYETAGGEILQNTYETLVAYDRELIENPIPLLVEEMPSVSPDGMNYTIKLRKGVQFAGGREMKADDVVFSLARVVIMGDPESPSWMLERVTTNYVAQYINQPIQNWIDDTDGWNAGKIPPQHLIDALGGKDPSLNITNDDVTKVANAVFVKVDDYTVRIRLTRPFPSFIYYMSQTVMSITDSLLVKDRCGAPEVHKTCDYMTNSSFAGTGPYIVDEGKWRHGTNITLELNPFWWRESQQGYTRYITKVIIRFDDYDTGLSLLKNGDVDFAGVKWEDRTQVWNFTNLRVMDDLPIFVIDFLQLNWNITNTTGMSIPPDFFVNKDIRNAFAYMFPYDEYIKNVLHDGGFQPQGPIPKGVFGYREDANKKYTTDPAKAEMHLKSVDGGKWWDNGFDITLHFNIGNRARESVSELYKKSIEATNPKFHVTVQGLDWPPYLKKSVQGELILMFRGWAGGADPDEYVYFLHSKSGSQYSNPQMDILIDQAAVETNETKRLQLYAQIQDLAFEDAPYIWIVQRSTLHVENIYIVGYYHNPMLTGLTYWAYMKGIPFS